ncbi:MAG: hypothetical protein DSO02_02220 [Hadesarchaea archaeon]|nr:MAG: hypothetical protein DSO03_00415 [Hadesarchaea archaeon]TDA34690.1 MAG: hypothetical protein DSO02_02220 [Hadesarchaea archaeon]
MNLEEFMREMVRREEEIVISLRESLGKISHPAVKGVLEGISLDSVKHGRMYEAALKLLHGMREEVKEEQLREQEELLRKHLRWEEELLEKIGSMLPEVKDEKVRMLLQAIREDERRHHLLLRRVMELLVRRETVTSEDLWDLLWKNVPFHGTPGG